MFTQSGKTHWETRILAGIILFAGTAALGAWYVWSLIQPVNPSANPEDTVNFVIPRGRAISQIGADLVEKDLIYSRYAFQYAVWKNQLQNKIQAGTFELSPSMDVFTIAQTLTEGTNDQWVTIKEGWRAAEIGEYLAQQLSEFSTQDPEFQTECLDKEGFLFPETYLVPKTFTTKQMCTLLQQQYGKVFTLEKRNQVAERTGLSDLEAVTLASIVEREARDPEQMRHVAGILLNRLEIGMALQVDATLQYAKGYDEQAKIWWAPPTSADKQIDSPYNTYLNPGLPPGPISNPGADALNAVANPIDSENLYYLHSPDGKMYYAATYEEHQQNIARYLD